MSRSIRLCTWMRSRRFVRRRASERSISSIPACFPVVQTLVARKSESRRCSSLVRSPMTLSARPYIGEVSTTLPPSWTKRFSTSLSGSRSLGESPTSKVREVPRPTAGIFSPEEGMERIRIADGLVREPSPHWHRQQRRRRRSANYSHRVASRNGKYSFMLRKSLPVEWSRC